MAYASKADENQVRVVEELRAYGCKVDHTHTLRRGRPDIIVGYAGWLFWFELKRNEREELTDKEAAFFNEWDGMPILRADSADGAIRSMDLWIRGWVLMYAEQFKVKV